MIHKITDIYRNGVTIEEMLLDSAKNSNLFNESFTRAANFSMIRELIQNNYVICQSIPARFDGSIVKYIITNTGMNRLYELRTIRTKNKKEVKNERKN